MRRREWQTRCDELIPCLSVMLKGRRERKTKMKLSPGKRERSGKGLFLINLLSLIGNKYINFSESGLSVIVPGE